MIFPMHSSKSKPSNRPTARLVHQRIERGGERLWQYRDFADLPSPAVAKALSRLARAGLLQRVSKGLYYRPRESAFGPTQPNPAALQGLANEHARMFPAGLAAANSLGFTTQNPSPPELATTPRSLPRKLLGPEVIVHTRRPEAWNGLSDTEGELLEFLRSSGRYSELSARKTANRLLQLLAADSRFERLLKAAATEPPRVRAMLGAAGQALGKSQRSLQRLRASLNPLMRFDFGKLAALPHAREWQARQRAASSRQLPRSGQF